MTDVTCCTTKSLSAQLGMLPASALQPLASEVDEIERMLFAMIRDCLRRAGKKS